VIRVVVVDDHGVVRDGVCRLLNDEEDITVVGEAATAASALHVIGEQQPDVAVLDLSIPDTDSLLTQPDHSSGLELIEAIGHRLSDKPPAIVMLSMHGEMDIVRAAMRAGAIGYVVKHSVASELVAAVRAASMGSLYLCAEVAEVLTAAAVRTSSPADRLSPREREVIHHVVEGRSSKEIAALLHTSQKTVEKQRRDAMRKLDVTNVAALVRVAIELDL